MKDGDDESTTDSIPAPIEPTSVMPIPALPALVVPTPIITAPISPVRTPSVEVKQDLLSVLLASPSQEHEYDVNSLLSFVLPTRPLRELLPSPPPQSPSHSSWSPSPPPPPQSLSPTLPPRPLSPKLLPRQLSPRLPPRPLSPPFRPLSPTAIGAAAILATVRIHEIPVSYKDILVSVLGVSTKWGLDWAQCVVALVELECHAKFTTKQCRLPVSKHPSRFKTWLGLKRVTSGADWESLGNGDSTEFGVQWWGWWADLKPDDKPLYKPGPTGMLLVLIGLVWWKRCCRALRT